MSEKTIKERIYCTVNQLSEEEGIHTPGAIRQLIFHEHDNGLAKSGAIIRIGRRVIVHKLKWFAWMDAQSEVNAA